MTILPILAIALAAGTLLPAQAAEQALTVELSVQQVRPAPGAPGTPAGAERLRDAPRARPGDLLEYRAELRNGGTAAVRDVVATLPIPAGGTVYVPGSEQPRGALASTDGRHFEAQPLRRWVMRADGTREQQLVPAHEYRALRWTVAQLAPGQQASVRARVRVDAGTPGAFGVGAQR